MTDTKVPLSGTRARKTACQRIYADCSSSRRAGRCSNEGILNISLLFKNKQMPTINEALGMDAATHSKRLSQNRRPLVGSSFQVADSYCPGDYDLGIQGTGKIAGIAQPLERCGVAYRFTSASMEIKPSRACGS